MDKVNFRTIRESFGRVTYTQKTHEKAAEIENRKAVQVKWINVALTTLTTTSLVSDLFSTDPCLQYASSFLSAATLAFVIFQLSFSPDQKAEKHRQVAKELWAIREKYINLLVDIKNESLDNQNIINQRDLLAKELALIYRFTPQTDSMAYKKAQDALKLNEELTFSDEELNSLLPGELHIS